MEDTDHKFNNKVPVSYHELVKDPIMEKLQLAKEFEIKFGKEQVLRVIEEMSVRAAVSRAGQRAKELNIRSLEDFARWMEKMHQNEVPRNTQTMETIELSAQEYHFKVRECLWAKVYRELNAPEYGLAFECCTDFPVCQVYNKALRLKREKTLMNGDDCCDFIYTWDEGSSE